MVTFKRFFAIVKASKLIHIFIVYVSSSAVFLEITDVLQSNGVLRPGVFSYVLWLLVAALPVTLVLAWILRKRMTDAGLGPSKESGPAMDGTQESGPGMDGTQESGPGIPGPGIKKPLHNIPESITRFIGREKEISELTSLVEDHRLVTVTGEGGCGKTRISQQIAREFLDKFIDGVWFVDLSALEDPELVTHELAGTLSIAEEPGKPIISTLKEQVREQKFMLVLDNCEHLVNASATMVQELLSASTDIKVLATSREPLKIGGEVLWKVPVLTLPPMEDPANLEVLARSEAVRLFVDRAENSKPGFTLNLQNAPSVAQICHQLEGIPLAIELAATRIRHMEPEMILDRIKDRFRILTSEGPVSKGRQKTLKAAIDWSYELLSEKEKLLFERLAVFSSGFTVETAEEVCAAGDLEKEEILDTLSYLLDKSMVTIKTREHGSVRYGMLETLKEYASLKLADRQEDTLMDERHFQYFLFLAEKAFEERLFKPTEWADTLEAEHDEYLKAVKWTEREPEGHLRLCGALGWFWEARGYYELSLHHLKTALGRTRDKNTYRARALMAYGLMVHWLPELAGETSDCLQKAMEIWEAEGNLQEAGSLHSWLGMVKAIQDDREAAMHHFSKAYEIFKSLGDPRLMTIAKFWMGWGYVVNFEPEKGGPFIKEAMEEAIGYNMKREVGMCRHGYADCALLSKDYSASLERYRIALKAVMDAGDPGQALYELQGVAMSLAGGRRFADAVRLNSAVLAQAGKLGITLVSMGFWDKCFRETIGMARAMIGEEKVAELEKEGSAMGFDWAVSEALQYKPL